MDEDLEAKRRSDELRAITRQLEQMSDWERGLQHPPPSIMTDGT